MEKSKELAEALIEVLEENMKLQMRIDKAIGYIKTHDIRQDKCLHLFIFEKKELLKILGDKENV